uniref:Sugar phosphate transporter domain-containing protein n=1 Tax=Aegilops tauschii TaxID=37682 RepID=M8BKC3_AEGTA
MAALACRAMEELRGSLYNEFHTSEGAKRQQQRFCGPGVALTFNFVVSVGIIMANKMVMGSVGFNFPVALSLIHYIAAWVLMAVLRALYLMPIAPPSKSTPFSSLFALGAVMSFSTGLANISLKHNSVGFYQMAKIAVTPTIVAAEFILLRKGVSFRKVITLVIVSFGVAVATVTDLEFNFFGACVAIAWIIPSAINKILWSNLQQSGNWTALALLIRLMWKTTPITIFFFLVLMPVMDPPGLLAFNWNFNNSCAIMISALLGFLLQWSGALALGATSALSHVVLGQFKTIVIMLSGFLVFKSDPGLTSLYGAVIALGGMSVYTYLGLKESTTGVLAILVNSVALWVPGIGEGKGIEGEGTILMAHHPSVRHKYIHTNGAPHPGAPFGGEGVFWRKNIVNTALFSREKEVGMPTVNGMLI